MERFKLEMLHGIAPIEWSTRLIAQTGGHMHPDQDEGPEREPNVQEAEAARRRPIRSRDTGWARAVAALLRKRRVAPNTISLASMGFSALAGLCFAFAPDHVCLWLAGALLVQGRLLCNLFDGMVAIEGACGSPVGELFNDLPDRVSDTFILIGFGWGLPGWWVLLGLAAALCAMFTAYVRVLGAACGLPPCFIGPMAKQHRMALITAGAVALTFLPTVASAPLSGLVLSCIILGCAVTVFRRLRVLAEGLRAGTDKAGA